MKSSTRYLLVLLLGVFLGAAIVLDVRVLAGRESKVPDELATLPVEEIRSIAEVYARIKANYVEPVSDKKLFNNAVQGMLSGLDPHSAYLDPDSHREMRADTEGQFGGLGIEVTMDKDGFVKVVAPMDDTPAARAGVKAGDTVIRLNDKAVKGMTLNEAVRTMRGRPGSDITLTIVREGESSPLKIRITRAVIKLQSVKQKMLEPGYGYVRITNFQIRTDQDLVAALRALEQENKGPLKGLILDLRNNPGGVLTSSIEVSDLFLDNGLIVYTEGRMPESRQRFSAKPGDAMRGAPLVVLVNGGSASASEIVAGALQDHRRAVIMGTKTFGKGSVQTMLRVSGGGALKLTTARYYTPKGRSIQAQGIVPDILVEEGRVTKRDTSDRLKEADLARHLDNGKEEPEDRKEDVKKKKDEPRPLGRRGLPAADDYQLNEALNLLKGVAIFSQRR
jgi:carboxyl-terminal processing protease